MSTAQDLPGLYGEPLAAPVAAPPALRLVPVQPLNFDDAVRRVRPRLHRYAIRRLGDPHEAEELVQEALLRAYTHREQLLTEEDLSAWTTVVTGRLVIDRLRVRGRTTSVADVPEGARVGRDTADVVVARDEARTALDALDAMPARQASLLWAREVEGRSYDELCQRFAMTEPAVRSVLTRARKALRREYELRGGTVPVGGLAVLAPWIAGLGWADKLRKAANKLTAPAVLGAAGIAALGGFVLSPYGADHRGAATFTPTQAVVASASHGPRTSAGAGAPSTAANDAQLSTSDAASGTSTGRHPHDVGAVPLAPLNRIPCTEAKGSGSPLPGIGTPSGLPAGFAFGGSGCWSGSDVGVGPDLPNKVVTATGYDHVTVSTNVVSCSQTRPLTTHSQLIQCSETQK
ncbi:MAG: Sigma-70 region 2 [Frankiales bacterium]|nr:Sigma-70 region 2 [Frankiales bacterium]